MKLKIFIFNILLLIFFAGNLQADPVVGLISDFNCASNVYTHTRNGKTLPVYFQNQLQEGDQIAINSEKNTISFELRYEKQIPRVTPEKAYTVLTPKLSIDNISGSCPPEAYGVQRHAEILSLPKHLSVGDRILVNKEIPMIKLKLGDKELVVNHNNSPYTVNSAKPVSWWSKLLGKIGQTITGLHDNQFKKLIELTGSRGGNNASSSKTLAPYTKLLKKHKARKLVAGIRPLYFAWKGGETPFHLTLTRERDNKTVFSLKSVEKRRIKTPALTLTEGDNYQLRICDAQKKYCPSYKFTVVNTQPDYPPELTDITAQATWLAAQNRKWFFEAYQQVAPLAENEGPAKIVRNALEQGARIKLPKN